MFEIVQAIVLGIIQGLTEFIPVSSSGHLVIVPWLLGWESHSLLFDTILHLGTLISIFVVFWHDLWAIALATLQSIGKRSMDDPNARLGWFIVVGSIPIAMMGLIFGDFFVSLFGNPLITGCFLLITAGLLSMSELLTRHKAWTEDLSTMRWRHAITIGLAQALALSPGISRSGSTIAVGLLTGLSRADAARFSFLLGSPAFFGAALLQVIQSVRSDVGDVLAELPVLLVGMVVSAVFGYLAIRGLLAYLRRRSLFVFAGYCLVMGTLVILLSLSGW